MSVRDLIQSADDLAQEEIVVPEWNNVKLLLIAPDAVRRGTLMAAIHDDRADLGRDDFGTFHARMICACAADPDTRELLYDLNNPEDIAAVASKNGNVVERVGRRCLIVAGMDGEAVEAGKDDSSSTPNDATSSD